MPKNQSSESKESKQEQTSYSSSLTSWLNTPYGQQAWSGTRMLVTNSVPGAVAAYAFFPLEALKKFVQRNNHTPWSSKATEKFYPFRGSAVFAGYVVSSTFLQLGCDDYSKNIISPNASFAEKSLHNTLGALVGAIPATFFENYLARLQVLNKEKQQREGKNASSVSTRHVLSDLYKNGGARRFFKGYAMVGSRDIGFVNAMFAFGEIAAEKANQVFGEVKLGNYELVSVAARFCVGLAGATVTHPFDTTGTQMQITHDKKSSWQMAKKMYEQGGSKRFFSGLPNRMGLFTGFMFGIPAVRNAMHDVFKHAEEKMELTSSKLKK